MIIENGFIVFFGLLLLFYKLRLATCLKLVGRPLALDVIVSVTAYALHWGTFSGVMAAAVAGMMTSGFTSAYRWYRGYIISNAYTAGVTDVFDRLPAGIRRCLNNQNHANVV